MSGTGRGRGWLNIRNNANRPGGNVTTEMSPQVKETNAETGESNQYKDLLSLMKQLNVTDDGIQMNRKLTVLYQKFATDFKNDDEIKECSRHIFQLGLKDEIIATNYAMMMSLKPFLIKPIYEVKLRDFLINELQEYFNNAKQQQTNSPKEFRNFVRMIARFTKAKLADGSPMRVFAKPLTSCFDMLLETARPEDIETLATQLNITLSFLADCSPEDLEKILIKIRLLLMTNELATSKCRTWLLLALDMSKYGYIPSNLYKVYSDQLGDKITSEFQVSQMVSSIQTPQPTISEGYADKNILQTSLENNVKDSNLKNSNTPKQNNFSTTHYNQSEQNMHALEKAKIQNHLVDKSPPVNNWEGQTVASPPNEKTGRPILGAGARLNKGNIDDWRTDDHPKKYQGSWDKPKPNFGDKNKFGGGSKPNKGWQHDDRFETDYN